jgi:hypothetical protein
MIIRDAFGEFANPRSRFALLATRDSTSKSRIRANVSCVEFALSRHSNRLERTKMKAANIGPAIVGLLFLSPPGTALAEVVDPGVRAGTPGGGMPLRGLTSDETVFFNDGLARFLEVESVTHGANNGLGPRFNSNQCFSCHSQPAAGGSSPPTNPLIALATLDGAANEVPWFITPTGPVREARFKIHPNGTPDGGVHDLFVITGRNDAAGCNIAQTSFLPAGDAVSGQGGNPNIAFRIPTPVFGAGLIESLPECMPMPP